MREARLVGLSQDGTQLILAMAETGEEFAVPVDDRLRAALRGDRARLGQLEIQMESALRPRDIQARIRAGESPEAVAAIAQMPMERVMAFAGPVLAERDHIASLAQRASVRRAALTELQVPVEPSGIPRTNSDPRATGLRSRDAVGIETARELPVAEAIVRATADSRHTTPPAKQTGQGARTPQLHIGAIDVTVVAPPAPESKAKPAASSPSRLPTVPARRMPWFGLAQR